MQQPPWLLNPGPRAPLPLTQTIPVAPRCYCLLTHYPFFTLHFKVGGVPQAITAWLALHASTPALHASTPGQPMNTGYSRWQPAARPGGSAQPRKAGRCAWGRGGCAGGSRHLKGPAAQVLHMIMGLEHMQSTNSFLQAVMGAPSPGPSAFAPAAARAEPAAHRQEGGQPDQGFRERRASHAAAGPSHSPPDSLGSSLARRAPAQPPPRPTERSRPPGLPLHHSTGAMHQPPADPGTSPLGADPGRIPPAAEASPSRAQHRTSPLPGRGLRRCAPAGQPGWPGPRCPQDGHPGLQAPAGSPGHPPRAQAQQPGVWGRQPGLGPRGRGLGQRRHLLRDRWQPPGA